MQYSLSAALAPYSAELSGYFIQLRPIPDDTVTICAVLSFRANTDPILAMEVMDLAVYEMRAQMEHDLYDQAADLGIDHCYWQYQAEAHFD